MSFLIKAISYASAWNYNDAWEPSPSPSNNNSSSSSDDDENENDDRKSNKSGSTAETVSSYDSGNRYTNAKNRKKFRTTKDLNSDDDGDGSNNSNNNNEEDDENQNDDDDNNNNDGDGDGSRSSSTSESSSEDSAPVERDHRRLFVCVPIICATRSIFQTTGPRLLGASFVCPVTGNSNDMQIECGRANADDPCRLIADHCGTVCFATEVQMAVSEYKRRRIVEARTVAVRILSRLVGTVTLHLGDQDVLSAALAVPAANLRYLQSLDICGNADGFADVIRAVPWIRRLTVNCSDQAHGLELCSALRAVAGSLTSLNLLSCDFDPSEQYDNDQEVTGEHDLFKDKDPPARKLKSTNSINSVLVRTINESLGDTLRELRLRNYWEPLFGLDLPHLDSFSGASDQVDLHRVLRKSQLISSVVINRIADCYRWPLLRGLASLQYLRSLDLYCTFQFATLEQLQCLTRHCSMLERFESNCNFHKACGTNVLHEFSPDFMPNLTVLVLRTHRPVSGDFSLGWQGAAPTAATARTGRTRAEAAAATTSSSTAATSLAKTGLQKLVLELWDDNLEKVLTSMSKSTHIRSSLEELEITVYARPRRGEDAAEGNTNNNNDDDEDEDDAEVEWSCFATQPHHMRLVAQLESIQVLKWIGGAPATKTARIECIAALAPLKNLRVVNFDTKNNYNEQSWRLTGKADDEDEYNEDAYITVDEMWRIIYGAREGRNSGFGLRRGRESEAKNSDDDDDGGEPQFKWQYLDNLKKPKQDSSWADYDSDTSAFLEEKWHKFTAAKRKTKAVSDIALPNGSQYVVGFKEMLQFNSKDTSKQRAVRRLEVGRDTIDNTMMAKGKGKGKK